MAKGKVVTLFNKFPAVRKSVTGADLMKAALAGGFVIEAFAKLNASRGRPGLKVKTGNLLNSIHTQPGQQSDTYAEAEVGTGVEYAAVHEYGGRDIPARPGILGLHIPARPYMRPAVDEHKTEIGQAVMEHLKAFISKAAK